MKNFGSHRQVMAVIALTTAIIGPGARAQGASNAGAQKWTAPSGAGQKQNPIASDEASIESGKRIYDRSCLSCHGTKGSGDGPAAGFLERHPGVLSDAKMWLQTDGALFWKITEGNSPMPSFRDGLSQDQRWQVVNYIRTLAPKPLNDERIASAATAAIGDSPAGNAPVSEEADLQLQQLKRLSKAAQSGDTKMMVVGYGTAGFAAVRAGNAAFQKGFATAFNPLTLWKLSDRLLFEGELEFQFEDGEGVFNLEVAQATYLLNDYMALGMGRFLNPMNFFVERQHMNWVNKMPDKPLAVYDGLLPESMQGLQLRGPVPVGSMKLEYSLYLINASALIETDPTAFGTLDFDNVSNVHNNLAYGGKVGFIPIPEIEIGYGAQYSSVGPADMDAKALLQSVDVNYVQDAAAILGAVSLRGQWVWSHIDKLTYDPDTTLLFGPVTFNNDRNGGYGQISYRPSRLSNPVVSAFEAVFRYDRLDQSKAPGGVEEKRWAVGLNYWLASNVVAKAAYERDDQGGSKLDEILGQFITGF